MHARWTLGKGFSHETRLSKGDSNLQGSQLTQAGSSDCFDIWINYVEVILRILFLYYMRFWLCLNFVSVHHCDIHRYLLFVLVVVTASESGIAPPIGIALACYNNNYSLCPAPICFRGCQLVQRDTCSSTFIVDSAGDVQLQFAGCTSNSPVECTVCGFHGPCEVDQ